MSRQTEHRFNDLSTWFSENSGRYSIVDIDKRWQFTLKALSTLLLVQAKIIEDIAALEGRGLACHLTLPSGVGYRSDRNGVA